MANDTVSGPTPQARRNKPATVVRLPCDKRELLNVRELMVVKDRGMPTVLIPKDLQKAIDRRARLMAEEAYEHSRQHLLQQLHWRCEVGHPRVLWVERAEEIIESQTLGDALLDLFTQKLRGAQRAADEIRSAAEDAKSKIDKALADVGARAEY